LNAREFPSVEGMRANVSFRSCVDSQLRQRSGCRDLAALSRPMKPH
jgi:hypothetical protein